MRYLSFTLLFPACLPDKGGEDDTGGAPPAARFAAVADATALCPPGYLGCLGQPSFAVSGDGRAFVAWIRDDPDHDGAYDDAVVQLAAGDGEGGWSEPMDLGPAGFLEGEHQRQLSVDSDGDTVVVAWYDPLTGDAHAATSVDGAQSFEAEVVSRGSPRQIAAAVRGDRTILAIYDASAFATGAGLLSRDGAGAGFAAADLPVFSAGAGSAVPPASFPLAAAIRPADGAAYAAYYTDSLEYNRQIAVWSPEEGGAPRAPLDTQGVQNDTADLALDFDGGELWLAARASRADPGEAWLLRSADQQAWDEPRVIPNDPAVGYGWAADLTAQDGRISAAFQVGSGTDGESCGGPVLAQSEDGGASFDLCALTGAADELAGSWVEVEEDESGRRQVVFASGYDYGERGLTGIIWWGEG